MGRGHSCLPSRHSCRDFSAPTLALYTPDKRPDESGRGRQESSRHSAGVKSEPLYEELQAEIGSLSDLAVHFTPECFRRYSWEERPLPGGGRDFSFGLNVGAIEFAFLMLSKHYELIFRVFDRCEDGRMLQHPEAAKAHRYVHYLHDRFQKLAKPAIDAIGLRHRSVEWPSHAAAALAIPLGPEAVIFSIFS